MADAPNVRNVNPDKPDKAPDVAHGAPGQAYSLGWLADAECALPGEILTDPERR